jgi:hypothetical protein
LRCARIEADFDSSSGGIKSSVIMANGSVAVSLLLLPSAAGRV